MNGPNCLADEHVLVPRGLLREVVADGCCPLHLRLQLSRLLGSQEGSSTSAADLAPVVQPPRSAATPEEECSDFSILPPHCLAGVSAFLPVAEVLEMRACGREPLQWAMQRGDEERGPRCRVHDRIRARLWMRRIQDLTLGTKDESIFETGLRSLVDQTLRSRMETEMQQVLAHTEEQIHAFQAEVDRRMEEQERHVRRMVEERVQQELDTILVAEVAKVQAMVEERVRERVSAIFRREVRETVHELHAKLEVLAGENETLRDAFAEANLRAKCLFWATHPTIHQTAVVAGLGLGASSLLSLRRRATVAYSSRPV